MVLAVLPRHAPGRSLQKKLIPRDYRSREATVFYACKYVDQIGFAREAQAAQQGTGLGHRFDDQQLRHSRLMTLDAVKERFIPGNVLDCADRLHGHAFEQAIYQHEWVAVRDSRQDFRYVRNATCFRDVHAFAGRGPCAGVTPSEKIGRYGITGSGPRRHGCAGTVRVRTYRAILRDH